MFLVFLVYEHILNTHPRGQLLRNSLFNSQQHHIETFRTHIAIFQKGIPTKNLLFNEREKVQSINFILHFIKISVFYLIALCVNIRVVKQSRDVA